MNFISKMNNVSPSSWFASLMRGFYVQTFIIPKG